MKWKFTFRQVDVSQALQQYTQERFEKISDLLLKESHWQINFSMGRYDYRVEVVVTNPEGVFKAQTQSIESLYMAVDEAADKLSRQFRKTKEKMQDHKKFDRSKQGRMKRVNSLLEYDNSPFPSKKTG